jgi:hypothetical protein
MTVQKYNRYAGVPHNAGNLLMRIVCFGEMGGPYYKDEIVLCANTKEELVEHCKKEKSN